MHSVTAATIAAGGGDRAGNPARAMASARRSWHARVQRARHGRALLLAGAEAVRANGGVSRHRAQELRHLGRARRRVSRARPGRGRGNRRCLSAVRRSPGSASTATGRASAWPATRASRSSSTTSRSARRRPDRRAGRGDRPRLQGGRAVLPRRARRGQRRHRRQRRGGGRRDCARARPPLPRRLVARRGAVRAASDRRHGHRARRPACSCARRLGSARRATRRRSSRSWRRRSPRPEAAAEVTGRALEVTGGQGYTPGAADRAAPARRPGGAVMAPTNAVLRSWIGKALAGLPVP